MGDVAFFVAWTETTGAELWKTDGTAAGTERLSTTGYPPFDRPSHCRNRGRRRFDLFHGAVNGSQTELWKSDGTPEGTVLVKDFVPGSGGSAIRGISGHFGGLFVSATTPEYGYELWSMLPESNGDYTADGVTDGADFLAWQRGFGENVTTPGDGADGNEDGVVDAWDLAIWTNRFGRVVDVGSEAQGVAMSASALGATTTMTLEFEEKSAGRIVSADLKNLSNTGGSDIGDSGAADAAFAWLAGDRSTMGRGDWQRSTLTEAELATRERETLSVSRAPQMNSQSGGVWGIGARAQRLWGAEERGATCNAAGEGDELSTAIGDDMAGSATILRKRATGHNF